MSSIFPDISSEDDVPKTFQELWNSLAGRDKQKYEYLRAHQLKILETLQEKMQNSSKECDYAISLPTGTGKTVVGLLLSYFLMLREKLTALYLCPNKFLCEQVLKDAKDLDISAVPLYGKWREISEQRKNNFHSGLSIGVATYNTLFNNNPQVGKVGLIIMDDVHAAGDVIISNWSIKIEKVKNPELFDQIYEIIRPILEKTQKSTIEAKPNINEPYEMLYSRQWLPIIDDLIPILDTHSGDEELKFNWKTIKNKLENYFCILHSNSIEIRPLTPPSHTLSSFNGAKYRFYMSATLDDTGNLENNVGIDALEWTPLSDIDVPGSRLILNLNTLMPEKNDDSRVISIVEKVNKTIILTQSSSQQNILKDALENVDYKGYILAPKSENISPDMETFKKEKKAVLLLAGRYDGIDLGNGIAEGIIMYHLPQAINSFENFTTLKWETKDESEARAIQRVHQGMGRCTRKDSDQVQIFLIGEDLVKLIQNPQTLSHFPGKLKEELEYCKQMKDPKDLDKYLGAFRENSNDWKAIKESITKRAAKRNSGTIENHYNKNRNFVFSKYSNHLWAGNYDAAQSLATLMMKKLKDNEKDKESAVWAYLGGVASDISSLMSGKNPFSAPGNELFRTAVRNEKHREWFGVLSKYLDDEPIQSSIESEVEIIYTTLSKFSAERNKFEEYTDELIKKLESGEDKNVKQFLKEFGTLLGYKTLVPSRKGSPDCIWSSKDKVDFIFEAKTNKKNDYLTIEEVRQIISIKEEVENNENLKVSSNLLPICITDVQKIAVEESHNGEKFFILRSSELRNLSKNWFSRLQSIQNRAFKDEHYLKYQVQQALITQRLTGKELISKLCKSTGNRILKTN